MFFLSLSWEESGRVMYLKEVKLCLIWRHCFSRQRWHYWNVNYVTAGAVSLDHLWTQVPSIGKVQSWYVITISWYICLPVAFASFFPGFTPVVKSRALRAHCSWSTPASSWPFIQLQLAAVDNLVYSLPWTHTSDDAFSLVLIRTQIQFGMKNVRLGVGGG